MVIKFMNPLKKLRKREKADSSSITKASGTESIELEKSLTELSDDSITLYSTIQSIWHEYQEKLMSIPCLDLLSVLASQEINRKNS